MELKTKIISIGSVIKRNIKTKFSAFNARSEHHLLNDPSKFWLYTKISSKSSRIPLKLSYAGVNCSETQLNVNHFVNFFSSVFTNSQLTIPVVQHLQFSKNVQSFIPIDYSIKKLQTVPTKLISG